MNLPGPDTLIGLLAAWLLIAAASLWAWREGLGLSRRMLIASLRGLVQLLVLASVLHLIFDIRHVAAQGTIIAMLCIIAARVSAGHHADTRRAWIAAAAGLVASCVVTLPWLVFSGAISGETRALIPLGSMVAANGMNAVSLMFNRMQADSGLASGIEASLIPSVDTLRVVGLVHMPGIFVGMLLAGSPPLAAASAQLVVLYMIVASCFTACIVSWYMLTRLQDRETCA
ncbi:MAG: ABC transporter permease [Mariprofundaceae bacterium]|nr:ABC transporter permease [Mariprofundaceae bacterium]